MKTVIFTTVFLLTALSMSAQTEHLTIQGSVGKLSAIIQKPVLKAKEKCPMVIIMHGFSGNKNEPLHKAIADGLEKSGIASIRFDFNGHGESEGEFQNMTVLNEIEDAKKIYDYVSGLNYVSKIAITGHSQVGVVASMIAGELGNKKIADVVLLAPAAVLRDNAARGNALDANFDPLNIPEYVTVFGDLKVGREYLRTSSKLQIYETAAHYKGAACLIHGTGDILVPYTYSVYFNELWKKSELHLLDGYDHVFSKDVHMAAGIAVDYLTKHLKNNRK